MQSNHICCKLYVHLSVCVIINLSIYNRPDLSYILYIHGIITPQLIEQQAPSEVGAGAGAGVGAEAAAGAAALRSGVGLSF